MKNNCCSLSPVNHKHRRKALSREDFNDELVQWMKKKRVVNYRSKPKRLTSHTYY